MPVAKEAQKIGEMKVVLTADTAAFDAAFDRAEQRVDDFTAKLIELKKIFEDIDART